MEVGRAGGAYAAAREASGRYDASTPWLPRRSVRRFRSAPGPRGEPQSDAAVGSDLGTRQGVGRRWLTPTANGLTTRRSPRPGTLRLRDSRPRCPPTQPGGRRVPPVRSSRLLHQCFAHVVAHPGDSVFHMPDCAFDILHGGGDADCGGAYVIEKLGNVRCRLDDLDVLALRLCLPRLIRFVDFPCPSRSRPLVRSLDRMSLLLWRCGCLLSQAAERRTEETEPLHERASRVVSN